MIVVSGTLKVKPDGVKAARAACLAVMAETRKEAGCYIYEFSQSLEEEGCFRIYEEWSDMDALKAHMKTAHMAVYREAIGAAGLVERNIGFMEAGEKTKV